jgi:hypothetical protein
MSFGVEIFRRAYHLIWTTAAWDVTSSHVDGNCHQFVATWRRAGARTTGTEIARPSGRRVIDIRPYQPASKTGVLHMAPYGGALRETRRRVTAMACRAVASPRAFEAERGRYGLISPGRFIDASSMSADIDFHRKLPLSIWPDMDDGRAGRDIASR